MKKNKTRFYVIAVTAIAVLVLLYALFIREPSFSTPEVSLPTARPSGEPNTEPGGVLTISRAEVRADTVQAVIATLDRADSYSRTVTIERFWNGGSSKHTLATWVSGGSTRIRLDRERDVQNILLKDGTLYIWYEASAGLYSGAYEGDGSSEADAWLESLTYEALLELPVSDIIYADYTEHLGESCIYAVWQTPNFGYTSTAYVSVSSGLLIGAETYDGETLIYRMSATGFTAAVPDESLFVPPDED